MYLPAIHYAYNSTVFFNRFEKWLSTRLSSTIYRLHDCTIHLYYLMYFTLSIVIYTLIGAAIFKSLSSNNWTYTESYYFATYEMSSVGYGNLALEGKEALAYTIIFTLASITPVAIFIDKVSLLVFNFRSLRTRAMYDRMKKSVQQICCYFITIYDTS